MTIAEIIAEQGRTFAPDEIVELPFRCWGCATKRWDFYMVTGDGVCLCERCFNGYTKWADGLECPKAPPSGT